jgi:hypothetical protein
VASHAGRDPPDAGPGVEPCAKRMERAIVRRHGASSEGDSSTQELAAGGRARLIDHLVRP